MEPLTRMVLLNIKRSRRTLLLSQFQVI